jgi:large conductance mechanosensitive channel
MTTDQEHTPKNEREKKVAAHARAKALGERSKESFVGKQVGGFMNFVREQGVVGLAVGLAIGTAATVFVKSIVDELINPMIGALLGGNSNLVDKSYCLSYTDGICVNALGWGAVMSNFISFLSVAAVIYFVVKGLKLDKLDKPKAKD